MEKHILAFSIVMLSLIGCGLRGANQNTTKTDKEKAHSDEIIFTPQQASAVGLEVETLAPRIFNRVIKTSGQIQSSQADEAIVVAIANGVVSFVNSSIVEGSPVKRGASVAVISAKNLPDGDPNAKVRITYETALKELKRAEKLIQDKIISTKEYEQIQLRHKTALTAFEAQSSNIVSNGVTVSAPIGGYVKNISVSQGEYVTVGQPIMTISENKRVQLRAEVSEKYFQDLKGVHSANFKMAYDDNIYKLSELNGRLLSFGKTSNEKSFFIPITFEFDNIGDIVTGSFAEVYLLSTPQKDVISIPISALTEEQGLYFVYLQIDEEGYKKQGVTLGDNNGERIRIVSGLKSGDKVVVKGAYQVKLASVSSVVPEGHNHNH